MNFAANGFRTAEISGVKINVTETPVPEPHPGNPVPRRDQVTVQAEGEVIQTASSTLGTVVGERAVAGLPLTTRNYTQILSLAAGVNAPVNNASAAGNGSVDVSVNGMDPSHNNYQMDGVSITPIGGGSSSQGFYAGIGIPSPDAIGEFKIQTSLYDAGYGRNPGANVNVVTKSGTNTWHGTGFEFFRNTALNANSFFQNRSGGGQLPLNQNQFGGVLGGRSRKTSCLSSALIRAPARRTASIQPATRPAPPCRPFRWGIARLPVSSKRWALRFAMILLTVRRSA